MKQKHLVYPNALARARAMHGRLGGLTAAANGSLRPDVARAAFERRFFEGLEDLPEEERARRALARRRGFYQRLSLAGLKARGLLDPEEADHA